MEIWMQALVFMSGFLLVLGIGLALSSPPRFVDVRLAQISGRTAPNAQQRGHAAVSWTWVRRLIRRLPSGVSRILFRTKANPHMKRRMNAAGFHGPEAASIYWGVRLLSGSVFFVGYNLLFFLGRAAADRVFVFSLLIGGMGFLLPAVWLNQRIRKRQDAIHRALPDFLDLLIICVEAGQGIDQALVRVGQELQTSSPALAQELHILGLETKAGKSRSEALQNLCERTEVEDLKSFSAMVNHADRYGVSIASSLRIFSETLRTTRRQAAEEKGAKTSIKISLPLVFFIFPSLLLIILGPAVLQILKGGLGQ